jgi:hypothetical protein
VGYVPPDRTDNKDKARVFRGGTPRHEPHPRGESSRGCEAIQGCDRPGEFAAGGVFFFLDHIYTSVKPEAYVDHAKGQRKRNKSPVDPLRLAPTIP